MENASFLKKYFFLSCFFYIFAVTYIIRCMEKKRDYFKVQGNPMVRIIRARDFRKFIEGD